MYLEADGLEHVGGVVGHVSALTNAREIDGGVTFLRFANLNQIDVNFARNCAEKT